LWIHCSDSLGMPGIFKERSNIKTINDWVDEGGKLLLTQEAMELLLHFGYEDEMPGVLYANAVDHGYGRKLGFHAFLEHPVFNDMFGGGYVFNPVKDQKTRMRGYFGGTKPNGKVVAVDWSYITFHEDRKLMLEYDCGKGKVMAIGAYVDFSIKNNYQEEFDRFFVQNGSITVAKRATCWLILIYNLRRNTILIC